MTGSVRAVERRLREEVAKLRVEINEDKSRMVDLAKGGSFTFLGFEYRRILSRNGVWRPYYAPKLKKRQRCLQSCGRSSGENVSQPVGKVIDEINPILTWQRTGWGSPAVSASTGPRQTGRLRGEEKCRDASWAAGSDTGWSGDDRAARLRPEFANRRMDRARRNRPVI